MFSSDHLFLRLFRIKAPGVWAIHGTALSFVFLEGGQGEYVSGPLSHMLSPGDVLIHNGDPEGRIRVSSGNEIVFSSFAVHVEHLYPLFASREIPLLQTVIQSLKRTKHHPATTPVADACRQLLGSVPPGFDFDHRAHLLRLAAAVIAVELKTIQTSRTGYVRIEERITRVFDDLTGDDIMHLSVDELAAKFSCSRRHLNRLFNQHFGLSVGALRMEMRLLKALTLLRDPNAKVINVAENCGFNHLGLFNACFKRRFGNSPGQWRKMNTEPPESAPILPKLIQRECRMTNIGLCPWAPDLGSAKAQFKAAC